MAEDLRAVAQRIALESPDHVVGASLVIRLVNGLEEARLLPLHLEEGVRRESILKSEDLLSGGEAGRRLGICRQMVNILRKQGHIHPADVRYVSNRVDYCYSPEEVARVAELRAKYPPRRGHRWDPGS